MRTDLKLLAISKQPMEEVSEKHDSDVSVRCDSGDVSEGCDSGEAGEGRDSGEASGSVEAIRRVSVSQFGEFVSQHHAHRNKQFRDNFEVLSIACIAIYQLYPESGRWRTRSHCDCIKQQG